MGGRGGGRGLRVVSRHPCEQVGKQASGRAGKQAGEPGRYGEARRATATASAARFPGIRLGVSGEQVFRFALPLLVSRFLFPFLFVPGAPYGVPASTASPVATTQREETFFLADVGAAYGPTWPSSWYSCFGSYRASGTRPWSLGEDLQAGPSSLPRERPHPAVRIGDVLWLLMLNMDAT